MYRRLSHTEHTSQIVKWLKDTKLKADVCFEKMQSFSKTLQNASRNEPENIYDVVHKKGYTQKTAAAIFLDKENPLDDGLVGCIFRVIKLFVLIKRFRLQVLLNEKLF